MQYAHIYRAISYEVPRHVTEEMQMLLIMIFWWCSAQSTDIGIMISTQKSGNCVTCNRYNCTLQLHCCSIFSQLLRRFKKAKDTDNAVHATALLRNLPYMMETFDPNVSTTSISLSWSLRTWHSLSSLRLLFSFSDVDNEVMKASSTMTSFTNTFSNGIRHCKDIFDRKSGMIILMPAAVNESLSWTRSVSLKLAIESWQDMKPEWNAKKFPAVIVFSFHSSFKKFYSPFRDVMFLDTRQAHEDMSMNYCPYGLYHFDVTTDSLVMCAIQCSYASAL